MKLKFKTLISITLLLLMVIYSSSCKKNEVKKIAVDTQFAIALFSDTVALRHIINDMDSTTQNWLRVRNDSIFVFYVDTIKDVLKASDLLDDISDVSFSTTTSFSMPPFASIGSQDTIINIDKFMTVPFHYDGYNIEEVLLRTGVLSVDFTVSPQIEHLKRLEVYSEQLISPEGEPLTIVINYEKGRESRDLAGYSIVPEADTVSFSARATMHIEEGYYPGGDYTSDATGGLTGVKFKTVYGTIDQPLDSIFSDQTEIDFGIHGISGSALLPIPKINIAYCNTFGFGAICDISKLDFVNTDNGLVTNLLACDMVELEVNPTEGAWQETRLVGFTENIDALAGYNRLDFNGEVRMNLNDNGFSISDTSTVNIATDIEMPFSFKLTDLCYTDTIAINLSDASQTSDEIDDYIDEIDFFIDYNSKIKLDIDMQAIFMKNDAVLDSLFTNVQSLDYSPTDEIRTITMNVNGRKLKNILRSNNMILRLGASTDQISDDPVQMMNSDAVFLRMRILTKTSEIAIDDND